MENPCRRRTVNVRRSRRRARTENPCRHRTANVRQNRRRARTESRWHRLPARQRYKLRVLRRMAQARPMEDSDGTLRRLCYINRKKGFTSREGWKVCNEMDYVGKKTKRFAIERYCAIQPRLMTKYSEEECERILIKSSKAQKLV